MSITRCSAVFSVREPNSYKVTVPLPDVDVLQVDAASITSSIEEQQQQQIQLWGCLGSQVEGKGGGGPADKQEEQSVCNDPRTYAHERGGSFPGSLSSSE